MPDLSLTRRTLTKLLGSLSLAGSASATDARQDGQDLTIVFPRREDKDGDEEDISVGATVVFGVEPLESDVTYQWTIKDGPEDDPDQLLQHEERDKRVTTFRPAAPTKEDTPYVIEVTARENGTVIGTEEVVIEEVSGDLESYGAAEIETKLELVEKFAPLLHFHEDEDYHPTRYEHYVENSVRPGDDTTDLDFEEYLTLLDLDSDLYEIVFTPSGSIERKAVENQPYPPTVYASVHEDGVTYDGENYVAITYWMFYLYDPKTLFFYEVVSHHPSDLETVTILLDEEEPEPRWIGASQHHGGTVTAWDRVVDDGSRLEVYPARGAHSSFLTNIEDYGGVPIPAQKQFLDDDSTDPELSRWPAVDWTGTAEKWVPTASDESGHERYDIVLLTGDEYWKDFDGELDSIGPGSGGQIAMHRDRWADPADWIDDNLVSVEEQVDASFGWESVTRPAAVGREVWVPVLVTNDGSVHHEFVVRAVAYPLVPGEDEVVIGQETEAIPAGAELLSAFPRVVSALPSIRPSDSEEFIEFSEELPGYADEWDIAVEVWAEKPAISDGKPLDQELFEEVQVDQREGQKIDASIEFVDPPDIETVDPGEPVRRTAHVENTGDVDHEFFVGYSAISPAGSDVFDGTGGQVDLAPGDTTETDLEVSIPAEAPAGAYTLVTAIWKESDPDALETRLDEDRREDHFEIHPQPRIEKTDMTTDETEFLITVDAANGGPTARWQSIEVSFPEVSGEADIEIAESTFDDGNVEVFDPGTIQRGEYGETEVELDHPLVRGYAVGWETGETNTLEVTVIPDQQDELEVHIKTVATAPGVLAADPSPGGTDVTDQQGEYVYEEMVSVEEDEDGLYYPDGKARMNDDGVRSVIPKVEIDPPISFEPDEGHVFDIVNVDTGEYVRVEPAEDAEIRELEQATFWLYDAHGEIYQPELGGHDKETDVVINGATDMFEIGDIFNRYRVRLVDRPDQVLRATEARFMGIGYPGEVEVDRTDEEVEVTFPRHQEVRDDWYARVKVVRHEDGRLHFDYEAEMETRNGEFVAHIDPADVDDGVGNVWVEIISDRNDDWICLWAG